MSQDLFRDTPVRYLGYANEVGEAFRPLVPTKVVWISYGIACAYVGCDAVDKSYKVFKKEDVQVRKGKAVIAACDALVWQSLASVVVPGITINRLCLLTRLLLVKAFKVPTQTSKYISVGVGLAAIPFIIKPIDNVVDHFMDLTLRPWLYKPTK